MNGTIGKYYSSTLLYIDNASVSEYYFPHPSAAMTCEQLQTNYDGLNEQIQNWQMLLDASGNSTEKSNLQQIIDIQTAKMNEYSAALQRCSTQPGSNSTTDGGAQPPAPAPPQKKMNGMLVLLAIAGIFLFGDKILK
jgi:hypothetical protein